MINNQIRQLSIYKCSIQHMLNVLNLLQKSATKIMTCSGCHLQVLNFTTMPIIFPWNKCYIKTFQTNAWKLIRNLETVPVYRFVLVLYSFVGYDMFLVSVTRMKVRIVILITKSANLSSHSDNTTGLFHRTAFLSTDKFLETFGNFISNRI